MNGGIKFSNRPRNRAFTLVEILLAVGLLSIIVVGLVTMFDLVQRSFIAGNQQRGVHESGKAALDLIVQDLMQADVSQEGAVHLSIRLSKIMDPLIQEIPIE